MNRPPLQLPDHTHWIDSSDGLTEAILRFEQEPELALDSEADSYYVYHVKVCLLQVSTRSEHFLVDPLAVDISPLAKLFRSPKTCKVWHAGSNDVGMLRHLYGFEFHNQFDTMLAAQVLGLRRPGLASLLQERFDITQKKTYQTSDWRRRPLSPGQLHYAATDTAYLLALKDQLVEELRAKNRMEEAEEEFERLEHAGFTARVFDASAFWRIRGVRDLDGVGRRALAELYRAREMLAAKIDRSPHRVLPDRALLELATKRPRMERELGRLSGMTPRVVSWQGKAILRTIAAAVARGPLDEEPSRRRNQGPHDPPMNDGQKRLFEDLRSWRRERALEREVDESRIATTGTLRSIAHEVPDTMEELAQVAGMTRFRMREYAQEILDVVETLGRNRS